MKTKILSTICVYWITFSSLFNVYFIDKMSSFTFAFDSMVSCVLIAVCKHNIECESKAIVSDNLSDFICQTLKEQVFAKIP